MAIYAVSEEGAAQIENIGNRLSKAVAGIDAKSQKLKNKISALSNDGRLGIYSDEIEQLIKSNCDVVKLIDEDISKISTQAKTLAETIRNIMILGGCVGLTCYAGVKGGVASTKSEVINPNIAGNNTAKPEILTPNDESNIKPKVTTSNNGSVNSEKVNLSRGNDNSVKPKVTTSSNGSVNSEQMNPIDNDKKQEDLENYLKPQKGAQPRSLEKTQLGYNETEDGCYVYDSPEETNKYLIQKQGKAYPEKYRGTCALCSSANILRQAGVEISEKDVIDYASNTRTEILWGKVSIKTPIISARYKNPSLNGGASNNEVKKILDHFGIKSKTVTIPDIIADKNIAKEERMNTIADYISEGKGVILNVNSDALWYNKPNNGWFRYLGDHDVTVTSVKKDTAGKILGFYINDTGMGGMKYYSAEKINESFTGSMIVTQIIR